MNILAIDTSTEIMSLALSADGNTWHVEINAGARHSELLMDWIDKIFASAGLGPKNMDAVICMKGPGSFTGLRIGYSAAKGFCAALGIPLLTVPTLDCIAAPASVWPGLVLPVLDAKKNSFFAALYRGGNKLTDYMDADAEKIGNLVKTLRNDPDEPLFITGNGAKLLVSRIENPDKWGIFSIDPDFTRGRAVEMLQCMETLNKHENCDILDMTEDLYSGPLYIRQSDAELNRIDN